MTYSALKNQELANLLIAAENRGITPEDLDEMIHEAKALEASNINNCGIEAQLEYLVEQYGPEQAAEMLDGVPKRCSPAAYASWVSITGRLSRSSARRQSGRKGNSQ